MRCLFTSLQRKQAAEGRQRVTCKDHNRTPRDCFRPVDEGSKFPFFSSHVVLPVSAAVVVVVVVLPIAVVAVLVEVVVVAIGLLK